MLDCTCVSCAESHVQSLTCVARAVQAMLESLRAFLLQSAMRLSSIGDVVTTKGRGQKEREEANLAFPVVCWEKKITMTMTMTFFLSHQTDGEGTWSSWTDSAAATTGCVDILSTWQQQNQSSCGERILVLSRSPASFFFLSFGGSFLTVRVEPADPTPFG